MPPKKKPFSNKQKKVQLQQRRQKKKDKVPFGSFVPPSTGNGSSSSEEHEDDINVQPVGGATTAVSVGSKKPVKPHHQAVQTVMKRYNPNRFRLHFHQEPEEEIERSKLKAKTRPVVRIGEEELEVSIDDVYCPGSILDIPKRPIWDYSMNKEQVEKREEEMFSKYVQDIFSKYSPKDLSYFELNLETWRQLWRVLEISDLVLMITDIRHPALHFSPALYKYVVEDLKKHIVLVLNKIDLVPPQVVMAWKHYFTQRFPDLPIACFSSFPNKEISLEATEKVKFKLRKKGGFKTAIGPRELYNIVESLMNTTTVDMSLWQQKLEALKQFTDDDYSTDTIATTAVATVTEQQIITIGMLGHPNVGKSSLINGLMEKKTVSTSRTPGHTKHFQTIFLTPNIRLCDCPGLVFPSLVPKQLQILSGMYPVAQVREPYSVVGYLAQRLPLVDMLSLTHPNNSPPVAARGHKNVTWTPWDICDAWAEKRGYFTRRGGKPDTYRAANDLLRLTADGRICLYFRPPGFHKDKAYWDTHPDVQNIIKLQTQQQVVVTSSDSSDDDDDDSGGSDEGSSSNNSFINTTETKFSALMDLQDTDNT